MSRRVQNPSKSSVPISIEERYGSLFENAGEGIFQTSISGRILDVNPALARSFGYRSPEEMKKDIRNVSRQIYTDRHLREKILRRVEARGHAKFEFQFRRRDNTLGWGYVSKHAVRNGQGRTAYYESFFLDMTAHRELEEKLREARDLLEQRVVERTRKIAKLNRDLTADIAERKRSSGNCGPARRICNSAPSSSRHSTSPCALSWNSGRPIERKSNGGS